MWDCDLKPVATRGYSVPVVSAKLQDIDFLVVSPGSRLNGPHHKISLAPITGLNNSKQSQFDFKTDC